ncbi:MAG TPA: hypothetical protein VNA89_15025 [Gemmatimonadaceae bacterium]|nr:hypothetical protein [Gemmatimonadaceae bacterium]
MRTFSAAGRAPRAAVLLLALAPVALVVTPAAGAQGRGRARASVGAPAPLDTTALRNLEWRNLGPTNMGGRVADVQGVPGDPHVVYVASASGGIWKTTNAGTTWIPIFDKQGVASIGTLALEPGNPSVIYAGTGEAATRNSVSFGDGVYKSTDGGATWRHLGLANSERISRILVSPRDPRVVLVGALGHIYGPGTERGVYLSADGGESWTRTLFIDEYHGVADMDLDPSNPNVVYAAMWRFQRRPWTHTSGSEQGGLFKSVDGGRTWKKLDKGLPKLVGRIGVRVAPGNPSVVYAITEAKDGTFWRSEDRGETWTRQSKEADLVNRGFYYTKIAADPVDEDRVYAISATLHRSADGGKTFKRISPNTHVDYHALWIDPTNPRRMWQGQDGGVAVSLDRGATWEVVNLFPIAQYYQIYADNRQPFYNVGGGLQDNGTWYGPARSREPSGIWADDWRMISFGDGFHIVVHPDDPELFLSEYQGGGVVRTDMRTREQVDASPQPRRNDGGPVRHLKYRFNWNAPIVQSPQDGKVVYLGSNVVFRSPDFGLSWTAISPDLTTGDTTKLGSPGGPVYFENTTAEYHATVISLAESPAQAGLLWAGTDDGNLQLTRDGGKSWTNLTGGLPVARFSPVSHVEPSRTAAGTAYVAFDRHMFDDFAPHVFRTTDFGRTWARISGDLPARAHVWVVREDPRNPQLLYAGTELGLFASWDGGGRWVRIHGKNLPTVAVHDVLVHPKENDLIIGTHGRGLWILDDAGPLQVATRELAAQPAELFPVRPAYRYATKDTRYGAGNKLYKAPNPAYGAILTYALRAKPDSAAVVRLEVLDGAGKVVRDLKRLPREAGLNRVAWDLALDPPRPRKAPDTTVAPVVDDEFGGPPRGPRVLPGSYSARLTVGAQSWTRPIEVRLDPSVPTEIAALRRQYEDALRVRDLQSSVNDALRVLDAVKSQLEERKQTAQIRAPQQAAEVVKALDRAVADVDSLTWRIARPSGRPYWSEGPRIAERLGALFGGIDGGNTPPSGPQAALLAELRSEVQQALAEVNRYLTASLGEINAMLVRAQGAPVVAPALDANVVF